MQLALVIDQERFHRERRMLDRIVLGLVDEGWEVVRLLPSAVVEHFEEHPDTGLPAVTDLAYPDCRLPWQRRMQISQLRHGVSACKLVYAVGSGAWRWGMDLAREVGALAVLDVWCQEQIRRVPRPGRQGLIGGYITATRPMAESLGRIVGSELVNFVPFGVARAETTVRHCCDGRRSLSVAMIDAGLDIRSYTAVLGALKRVLSEGKDLQLVIELRGPQQHELWQQARALDLLDHVASVSDAAQCRSLLVECDLMLVPDRYGQMRSIILEAMAHGVPIIASADPMLDLLEHGRTGLMVADEQTDQWHDAVSKILNDSDLYQSISRAASQFACRNHPSSRQIAGLVQTFEQVLTGGAIAFQVPEE